MQWNDFLKQLTFICRSITGCKNAKYYCDQNTDFQERSFEHFYWQIEFYFLTIAPSDKKLVEGSWWWIQYLYEVSVSPHLAVNPQVKTSGDAQQHVNFYETRCQTVLKTKRMMILAEVVMNTSNVTRNVFTKSGVRVAISKWFTYLKEAENHRAFIIFFKKLCICFTEL